MTELNHITEPDPDRGEARVTWPAAPATQAEHEEASGNADSRDAAVDGLLDRLTDLQDLPVLGHRQVLQVSESVQQCVDGGIPGDGVP